MEKRMMEQNSQTSFPNYLSGLTGFPGRSAVYSRLAVRAGFAGTIHRLHLSPRQNLSINDSGAHFHAQAHISAQPPQAR